jgi:hypothetical protein
MAVDALRLTLDPPPGEPRRRSRRPASATADRARTPRAIRVPVRERIVAALRAAPGQTIGELAAEVGGATGALQPVVKALIVGKQVRFQGKTRARRYFVAGPRASAKAAPSRANGKPTRRRRARA